MLDKRNGNSNYHSKIRKILNDIINSCELNDVWRILNPEKKLFSWFSNTKPRVCSRIDYYLASNSLMNSISYCSYYPGHRTDHSAVLIKLNLNIPKRGPGYFKFNNSLLQDETFLKNIENCIQQTENDSTSMNASWVKRYLDKTNNSPWKYFYSNILQPYGGDLVFGLPFTASQYCFGKVFPV